MNIPNAGCAWRDTYCVTRDILAVMEVGVCLSGGEEESHVQLTLYAHQCTCCLLPAKLSSCAPLVSESEASLLLALPSLAKRRAGLLQPKRTLPEDKAPVLPAVVPEPWDTAAVPCPRC